MRGYCNTLSPDQSLANVHRMRDTNDGKHPGDMTEAEFKEWAQGMWEGLASQPVQFVWKEDAPTFTAVIRDEDQPVIEMELRRDGLRPISVTLGKREGLLSQNFRIPLERLIDRVEDVVKHSGMPAVRHGSAPAADPAVGQRRRLTDEFLRAVGDAYTAAGGSVSGINTTVDPRFEASDSQKFRWLRLARERGLLADES